MQMIVMGTRPEAIKLAPLIIHGDFLVVHTGQHEELVDEVFDVFGIEPDVDLAVMEENQTLDGVFRRMTPPLIDLVEEHEPEKVVVQGDTASALAGAFAAQITETHLAHVEAGLRSGDYENPYPEELFRQLIDHMADTLFASTEGDDARLIQEEIIPNEDRTVVVSGNTAVDMVEMLKRKKNGFGKPDEPFILATLHRREARGERMQRAVDALDELAKEIKVIFPAHPAVADDLDADNIDFREPMQYPQFIQKIAQSECVVTDSGGIQEEAPSLRTPVVVVRKATERQAAIDNGFAKLVQWNKQDIIDAVEHFREVGVPKHKPNPFGDGEAYKRIIKELQ